WALHSIGLLGEAMLVKLLDDPNAEVRGWVVRLLVESRTPSPVTLRMLGDVATREQDASVRLALASAMQRLPLDQRAHQGTLSATSCSGENDANLPLMIWYGVESTAETDPSHFKGFLHLDDIRLLRRYAFRRLASSEKGGQTLFRFPFGAPNQEPITLELL